MTKVCRNGVFWGVSLIMVGGLFMLSTLGLLKISIWNLVFPAFLVFWGLWVLFGMFTNPRTYDSEGKALNIPHDGAERARIRLHHRAGRLQVSGAAPADQLIAGTFWGGADYDVRRHNATLEVDMRGARDMWSHMFSPWDWHRRGRRNTWSRMSAAWNWRERGRRHVWPRMFAPWNWRERDSRDWDFALNGDVPLELSVESGFNEMQLDLGELRVTDLELQTSTSAAEVTLPAKAEHTRARFCATMSDIKVYVPEGVAARIHATSGWADVSVNEGRFPRSGDVYQSPDYDRSEHKVEIEANSDMGTLKII